MDLYGMEKLSLVDFDGYVASTVFTGSCNFRCPFCHNAPLVLSFDTLQKISEEEVFSYLNKRKGIIEGLCITGGEPTLQKDLPAFCEKVKKLGLPVKLDTNGTNPDMVKLLHENNLVDYFAMDIKNDRDNYAKIIGLNKYDTKNVEKTVDFFISNNLDYEFRTTLIKEFHGIDNVIKISEWIKGANKYFFQKFKNGDNCITNTLHGIELQTAKEFEKAVKPNVKHVGLRGYDY